VWLALVDLRPISAPPVPPPAETSPLTDFIACGATAAIVSLVHVLGPMMNGRSAEHIVEELGIGTYRHLLVFLAAFAAI
jgi:hypothetical protein